MKSTRSLVILILALGMILSWANISNAAPMGTAFTYQGHLYDANHVADGVYDFQFKLYDSDIDGSQIGSNVNVPDVDVIDGHFTEELDFGSGMFEGDARWLEIGVRPGELDDPNVYTTLTPRQEVAPAPYALYAKNAGSSNIPTPLELIGSSADPIIEGTNTGTGAGVCGIYDSSYGKLGSSSYGAYGYSSNNPGVYGESNTHRGVYGISGGIGVYGEHDSGNYGYLGNSSYGVRGYSASGWSVCGDGGTCGLFGGGSSYGAYGQNSNNSNHGYLGHADYGVYGVYGSAGNYGYFGGYSYGVYGKHESSGNYGYIGNVGVGVFGKNASSGNNGYLGGTAEGVRGYNNTSGNYGYLGRSDEGVYGEHNNGNYGSLGSSDYGAYGEHDNGNYGSLGSSNYGVKGSGGSSIGVFGTSASGYGVSGFSGGSYGVAGVSHSSHGVYGTSTEGYAGYFSGDVYVTKNVSALSYTDRTPYPKDLATAYRAVMSMERMPDGQYEENNKENQLDHSKLNSFIRSKDGDRDLSATVSCLNEVVKDLVGKVKAQQRLIETQSQQIQQMTEMLQTNNTLKLLSRQEK